MCAIPLPCSHEKVLNSCNTLVDENQNDLDQTILNLNENSSSNLNLQSDCANDYHDDSITSIKSIVQQDDHTSTSHTAENPTIVDHFSIIEKIITNAIMEVENQQTNDHSKSMTAINSSCKPSSTLIKAKERSKDQSKVTFLQKMINTLRQRLQHLENHFKIQEGNMLI
ncbi:unnamed protein product [Mytilus coruscus]|uniref:Uncharacterized protein n=1 Tax=Mytilus coruscus TaxID=42192 RepID=A0A6J8E3U1_MYTCO|nr:unnamed protein product [Mytilus coruscus]